MVLKIERPLFSLVLLLKQITRISQKILFINNLHTCRYTIRETQYMYMYPFNVTSAYITHTSTEHTNIQKEAKFLKYVRT